MTRLDNEYDFLEWNDFMTSIIGDKKPSVLLFYAEWSGNAEIMDSMISRIQQEFPPRIAFYKVDIDEEQDLLEFYGIRTVPTIIMVKNAQICDFIKGLTSASNLRKKIKQAFLTNNT